MLNNLKTVETVSFVTHSMGGLVVRELLAGDHAWKHRISVSRVVMIAPPNQGAALAKTMRNAGPYRVLFGPAGQNLTPAHVARIPVIKNVPVGVIAGGRGDNAGFNPLLPGDDDGTVRVVETPLAGAADFAMVDALHGFISNHPSTINLTIAFLRNASFSESILNHEPR